MRWVDDPEELAFLDRKKQINEQLSGFDEEATELSAMFKVSVTDARHD